jgi:hypothetical protein
MTHAIVDGGLGFFSRYAVEHIGIFYFGGIGMAIKCNQDELATALQPPTGKPHSDDAKTDEESFKNLIHYIRTSLCDALDILERIDSKDKNRKRFSLELHVACARTIAFLLQNAL